MKQNNNYRVEFEVDVDDMHLQWQFTAFLKKVVNGARADYLRSLGCIRANEAFWEDQKDPMEQQPDEKSEHQLDAVLSREIVQRNIVRLTKREQQVRTMCYLDELSMNDIASRLGISRMRAYSLKRQATIKLRAVMEEGKH